MIALLAGKIAYSERTDIQTQAWDGYAAALKDAAKAMGDQRMAAREKMNPGILPQRIEMHEAMLVSQLKHLRKTKAVATALYAVLSDAQKKIAHTAMMGPTPRGRMPGPMRKQTP